VSEDLKEELMRLGFCQQASTCFLELVRVASTSSVPYSKCRLGRLSSLPSNDNPFAIGYQLDFNHSRDGVCPPANAVSYMTFMQGPLLIVETVGGQSKSLARVTNAVVSRGSTCYGFLSSNGNPPEVAWFNITSLGNWTGVTLTTRG
jgi:hypothetical protein